MVIEADSYNRVLEMLNKQNVDYNIIHHKPVYTMRDVANELDIPENSKVKTLVLKTEQPTLNSLVICGISAQGKLDFKLLATLLNTSRSKLSMASSSFIMEEIGMSKGAIGLLVPKGEQMLFLSNYFSHQRYLYFGIGRNDKTIKISRQDLLSITNISVVEIEKRLT